MNSFSAFAPFSLAEQKLIDDAANPERTSVGDGELPKSDDPDRVIRGELIRHPLLQFDALHDKGIRLRGLGSAAYWTYRDVIANAISRCHIAT